VTDEQQVWDGYIPPELDQPAEAPRQTGYREEKAGSGVRLENVAESPIGQASMFPELESERMAHSALLTDRFVVPPFSVLDTRAGYWQARKAQWLALGIQSELGRGEVTDSNAALHGGPDEVSQRMAGFRGAVDASPGILTKAWRARAVKENRLASTALPVTGMAGKVNAERTRRAADRRSNLTGAAALPEYADNGTTYIAPGTSIFDPVVCELAYRWWTPAGGRVLDPFSGGSVRGIVASMLGHPYVGVDLSGEQVAANRAQADAILAGGDFPPPAWIEGDSASLPHLLTEPGLYDVVFSCPPYYDLEVYSDRPGELSRMPTYAEFLRSYRLIIQLACERLRPERFAVWVVGEIRDKRTGWAQGFVTDTVQAFRDAGLHLYNEAVLVNPVGTLALRAPKQFIVGRKLGRTHQSVLVFYKGDVSPRWASV
jgi:hypothetical protein